MAIEVGGVEVGEKIWHNGELKPWADANIHVMSHVVHYGSSLFEGIRCYATERGPAICRLGDHVRRLMDSCHIYRMPVKYSRVASFSRIGNSYPERRVSPAESR